MDSKEHAEKAHGEAIEKFVCNLEKSQLLAMSEISISLEDYSDIFSDFDPRSFAQRSLSDDFLFEAKRAARDKNSGRIELRFMIQGSKRKPDIENTIKKRLHSHFRRHHEMLEKEKRGIIIKGLKFTFIGVMLLFLDTYIYPFHESTFMLRFFYILLEPAGWFTAWTGLDQIFYTARESKEDLEFYRKMSKCDIKFYGY